MIKKMNIEQWIVECDYEATQLAYSQVATGSAEQCSCDYCHNFVPSRENVYPKKVCILFDQIGIDYKKEFEIYFLNKEKSGLYCYGGEFCFVGSLQNKTELVSPDEPVLWTLNFKDDNQNFTWILSDKISSRYLDFSDKPLLLFIFAARIPWVIKTKEPR